MKPATYTETVEIVRAWAGGQLKVFLSARHITYECAKKRMARLRRDHPDDYRAAVKCPFLSLAK
jgi:hypothetical protein